MEQILHHCAITPKQSVEIIQLNDSHENQRDLAQRSGINQNTAVKWMQPDPLPLLRPSQGNRNLPSPPETRVKGSPRSLASTHQLLTLDDVLHELL